MALYDFTRLKRLVIIYRFLQVILILLLMFIAYNFRNGFIMAGNPGLFIKALAIGFVIQLILLYPALILARQEMMVNIDAALIGQTPENLMAIRKRRLLGELWKVSFAVFFAIFLFMLPGADKGLGARMVIAASYFGFMLAFIAYFQCFNFVTAKKMKELN